MSENRDFKGVWIPRHVYLDKRLSALDKMILVEIDSLDSTERGCFASNKYLADHCQCGERTVSRTIAKLETVGYITVENDKGNGNSRKIKSHMTVDRPRQNGETPLAKMARPSRQNGDIVIQESDISSTDVEDKGAPQQKTPKDTKRQKMIDTATIYALGDTQLLEAITSYIDYRLETSGKKFTYHALDLSLKTLDKLGATSNEKIAMIEQTISRGWSGIFKLDEEKRNTTQPTAQYRQKDYTQPIPEHKDWDI